MTGRLLTTRLSRTRRRPPPRRPVIGTLVPTTLGPVHVRVDGPESARPVLLVHGFCGSMQWYDRIVPLLADRYRVIRVDLLGHGSTGGAAWDAPEQADAVGQVLAALDVHEVTAVGHSFGADVAVELAEHDPRVDSLVIITQAPDYSDATLPRAGVVMTLPVLPALLLGAMQPVGIALGAVLGRTRGFPAGSELARQGLADLRALDPAMFEVVLVQRRDRMAARPLDAQLRDSGVPSLVLLGGKDHFYGDRSAGRYRAAGATVEIFADSGHSPIVERPGRTARALRTFLDALDPPATRP